MQNCFSHYLFQISDSISLFFSLGLTMSTQKLILGTLAVVCLIMTTMAINPGTKVRITKKGFDYGKKLKFIYFVGHRPIKKIQTSSQFKIKTT